MGQTHTMAPNIYGMIHEGGGGENKLLAFGMCTKSHDRHEIFEDVLRPNDMSSSKGLPDAR